MFTRFVFPVLILSGVIAVGYWVQLLIKKLRVTQRIERHLLFLEQRYLEFVHDKKVLSLPGSKPHDQLIESIVAESHPVLKPEIDALLDQLDQANQAYLPESLDSEIFPNVLAAYRSIGRRHQVSRLLTDEEKESFREAIAEAVWADISRRILRSETDSQ